MTVVVFPPRQTAGHIWRRRVERVAQDLRRLPTRLGVELMKREIGTISRHLHGLGCSRAEIEAHLAEFSRAVDQRRGRSASSTPDDNGPRAA